jgi:multicomponent K+:H+ antiporter subunit D
VLNLAGSSLFLIAVGVLYGVTGTLNLADLAVQVAAAGPENAALIRSGALLLLVVFALKAALLPLYFWLPEAYSAASAPVAALFAIMTKVGVYAIVRIYTLIFGPEAGVGADVAGGWLLPLALATLAFGTLGAITSPGLRRQVAYLVIASVGTLLTAVGLFSLPGLSAAIYYLLHSTLIAAGLFLLADLIARQRGEANDRFEPGTAVGQPALLGALFFVGAVAVVGVPPLSGFLGKLMVLQAAPLGAAGFWVWAFVLASGLLMLIGMARAGSTLFWKAVPLGPGMHVPLASPALAAPAVLLLGSAALLALFAAPVAEFADATARQLLQPVGYIEAVLYRG